MESEFTQNILKIEIPVLQYHRHINLEILRQYAITTTSLFAIFAVLPLLWVSPESFGKGIYLAALQFMSLLIFIAVLATSMMGTIFHQLVSFQPRSRNAFAFIFSISAVKMIVTLVVFRILESLT